MKWWRRFWRRRKQDDRIKIMLIFFLAAIIFLADSIHGGIQVYNMVKSPVEYVVSGSAAPEITNYQISGMETLEDVRAVSRQRESSMVLSGTWGEITVNCLELSDSYLDLAYGISDTGAMKVIYLNEMAWAQLMQATGEVWNGSEQLANDFGNEEEQTDSRQLDYKLDDEEESGTARIVRLESGVPDGAAYAFCAADSVRLLEKNTAVRIQMAGRDLAGKDIKRLNQLGLEVANSGDVEIASMEQEMKFMQIKYDGIALVLCLIGMASLKKYGRRIN